MVKWLLRRKVDGLERRRDLEGLAELLRYGQPAAVALAASALGRIGGRDAVSALDAGLARSEAQIRRRVVHELALIPDPAATSRLAGLLYDDDSDEEGSVGRYAAQALRRIGDWIALSALVDAWLDKDFPGDRAALAKVLSHAIVRELPLSVRPKYLARDAAANARWLVWVGDFHSAFDLLFAVGDAVSAAEKSGVSWAGAGFARSAANGATSVVQRMKLSVGRYIDRPDASEYTFAAEHHELVGAFALVEAYLSTMPAELETPQSPLVTEGAEDDWFVHELTRLAGSDGATMRGKAIDQIGRLGGKSAIPVLRQCLDEDEPAVRHAALVTLTVLDGLHSINDLSRPLEDDQWVIRLAAVAALAKLNSLEAIEAVRARLDDNNHEVRMAALAIVAKLDGRVLRQGAADPHGQVRARAALVAGDLDDPQWAEAIEPLLTDSYRFARVQAWQALSQWAGAGDPVRLATAATAWDEVLKAGVEATEPLMHMLNEGYAEHDPDKEPALRALERLVERHAEATPEWVLRTGADFKDFPGEQKYLSDWDEPVSSQVDASRLRRLCRAALEDRR